MAAFDRVALLRAVNVGGRQIAMAELRALFDELGFSDAKTLLNSGNIVFTAGRKSDAQLERLLESSPTHTCTMQMVSADRNSSFLGSAPAATGIP
jgi:uncharacterized protein (DUF1697 family)